MQAVEDHQLPAVRVPYLNLGQRRSGAQLEEHERLVRVKDIVAQQEQGLQGRQHDEVADGNLEPLTELQRWGNNPPSKRPTSAFYPTDGSLHVAAYFPP